MSLYLKQIEVGPLHNYVYLVGSSETGEAAVIDPAWEVDRILEEAQMDEMTISKVLITHTHPDHINGVQAMLDATDAEVYVHDTEVHNLPVERSSICAISSDEDFITIGPYDIEVFHTPGHTPGSLCYGIGDRMLTGDTLFIGGCGRCDLPGGDPEQLYNSLKRLERMDGKYVVYPGHNYAADSCSTIRLEKENNPFMKAESFDQFKQLIGFAEDHERS